MKRYASSFILLRNMRPLAFCKGDVHMTAHSASLLFLVMFFIAMLCYLLHNPSPLMELACLFAALMGIKSWEKGIPQKSLPTSSLPKETLLFSLLLPAVKLL